MRSPSGLRRAGHEGTWCDHHWDHYGPFLCGHHLADRDDLPDGGAAHFAACIRALRARLPGLRVEVLVPDFRKRVGIALEQLREAPPDVSPQPRDRSAALPPGAALGRITGARSCSSSVSRLSTRRSRPNPGSCWGSVRVLTRSARCWNDLREHDCEMLTICQYLQPSPYHLRVERFVSIGCATSYVLLYSTPTGDGMPPEQQPPFRLMMPTRSRQLGGVRY
jgi:hypothetical protein